MRYLGHLGRSGGGVWVRKAMASEVLILENMVTNGTYGDFREKQADSTGTWWIEREKIGEHWTTPLSMSGHGDGEGQMEHGAFQRKNGCKNGDMNKWNMVISKDFKGNNGWKNG